MSHKKLLMGFHVLPDGSGREEPVFMRSKGSHSPVFPPQLVLPEGPLAVALPIVDKPLKTPSDSTQEKLPKWGESRYCPRLKSCCQAFTARSCSQVETMKPAVIS